MSRMVNGSANAAASDPSLALLTDLYQLTMAYGYWKTGTAVREAVFHVHFRRPPFAGGFAIACGLAAVLDYVRDLSFSDGDLEYLAQLTGADGQPLFDRGFCDYLPVCGPSELRRSRRKSADRLVPLDSLRRMP